MPDSVDGISPLRKILLVEDDLMVRRVCERVIERGQFQPVLAGNGAEGLELYRQSPLEFVLVLSDVGMPVMDGISMTRKMFELNPHSNVILMTGYHADQLVPDDLKRLCSTLNKPFTPAQLIAAIRNCLEYEEKREASAGE